MSGRKGKKIPCPFLFSKELKRWKSDGTDEFSEERALRDCGLYYNQDECTFCPSVFHLFTGSEHSEHWLARSTCWPTCLFHLEIFSFWLLEAWLLKIFQRSKRCKVEQHNTYFVNKLFCVKEITAVYILTFSKLWYFVLWLITLQQISAPEL